ncbi:hypothetical protein BGW80DRAFT_1453810 [Lactifluus volemus]|nr:hypothetical protein BGW80DRAFT_1453810 [Lactifluus volemus]
MKCLNTIVPILLVFSGTVSDGVSLTFSPAKVIFSGICILLQVNVFLDHLSCVFVTVYQAAKDAAGSHDVLSEIFERIQAFLTRVKICSGIELTKEMTEMLGKIMAEVLCILTLSTKEIKQGILIFAQAGRKREIESALQRLDKLTQEETRMTVASTLQAVDKINRSQSRSELRNWLFPPDPSINHRISRSRHHEGTATWFFDNTSFNEWKSSHSLLWINGKPGSGKSILCSSIVENIKDMSNDGLGSICYFYFDYKDTSKRDIHGLLSSLLDMLNLDERLPVYIIIDALDECPNTPPTSSPRGKVLDLLEDLSLPSLHIPLHDQGGQRDDIINYVDFVVHSHKGTQKWRSEDKDLVIQRLSEGANGMFRWVVCQLDRLCQSFPSRIRKILDDLPMTLDETYIQSYKTSPRKNGSTPIVFYNASLCRSAHYESKNLPKF